MKKKIPKTVSSLKKRLKNFLPEKIFFALKNYDEFAGKKPNFSSKEFAAHHSACKAVISHVEVLIKLLKWSEEEEEKQQSSQQSSKSKSEQSDVEKLINEAKKAIEKTEV